MIHPMWLWIFDKFHKKTSQEREERKKNVAKTRNFGPPTFWGPTLWGPTLRGPTLRGPAFWASHPSGKGPTLALQTSPPGDHTPPRGRPPENPPSPSPSSETPPPLLHQRSPPPKKDWCGREGEGVERSKGRLRSARPFRSHPFRSPSPSTLKPSLPFEAPPASTL